MNYVKVSDDLTIHYEQSGSGDTTILFVPGLAMSTEVFSEQLKMFEGSTEYRFVTYDPRGHGLSSKTEGGHYYQQHARDLNAFILALELHDIILGGWSYGGNEALAYVSQFGTDALKGFVLIDSTPKATGADNTTEWVWFSHDDTDGFRAFFTMGFLLDRIGTNRGFAEWMLEDKSDENLNFVIRIANQTTDTTAALLQSAGNHDDFTTELISMEGKVPLLYIFRKEWEHVVSEWANKNTPSAMISATMNKHMSFWEFPDVFNQELNKFLDSI